MTQITLETTLESFIRDKLYQHGLPDGDCDAVLVLAKEEKTLDGRWREPVLGYPPIFQLALWDFVRGIARTYIDEHCPGACYRPLFVEGP